MDIYLLREGTYERIVLIDEFESFIWTERQSGYGDFELKMTPSRRWDNIYIGRYIANSLSKAIMRIEEKHEATSATGERILTIRGRSMESILQSRIVVPWGGRDVWKYTGTTGEAIYYIIRNFVIDGHEGMSMGRDAIPDAYMFNGTEDTEILDFAISPKSVYDAAKELSDTKNFTFGVDLRKTSPKLRFYVQEGKERNIVFSTQLDTLTDPSFLESELDYYNVAYIWSKGGTYRTSVGIPDIYSGGFERKVLSIYASDLDVADDVTTSQLINLLQQRGREELYKHKKVRAFDGQLTGLDPYIYRAHYSLGDIVTLMDGNGRSEKVRVSEYIYSQDANGIRHYPTFSTLNS